MYFITTIDPRDRETRCIGYYSEFKKAEKSILDNKFDIWETCYDYAVIENIPEGIYQYDSNAVWYEWDDLRRKYEKIGEPPEKYKGWVGIGIG